MKKTIVFLGLLFLAACGSIPTASGGVSLSSKEMLIADPQPTSTPTVDEVGTAMMVLARDAATSTSEAQASATAYMVTATAKAESTQAFWDGVTLAVSTQHATETQIVKTAVAGTEQANFQTGVPLTSVAGTSTAIIQQDERNAQRVSIWINKVSASIGLLGIVLLGLFVLYKGVRFGEAYGNAKSLKAATDALKPDEQGRLPLVPEKAIDGRLINPNLMHRATLDPKVDDLTSEQALGNTRHQRQLEVVRSMSNVPVLRSAAKDLMRGQDQAEQPKPDVKVTKPDLPALPELPAPHWKLLNKWDGDLLPVGTDENGELLRIDPAQRAHLMYVGRSGTGKSLTGIRTEVACLLTQGWNVICMGKRVDFMPFEDHPNFKLIAVDVRKDAGKYIDILNTLTAQMDVRDQLMAARNVSTWERYGAPETMIVLDDYSGAMMRMDKKFAALVLNEVKQIAMDGRKFGLHLTIGLQRATWENIDTDLRSQMGRIVYAVESAGDSRIALGSNGAEALPAFRHFLTRMADGAALQRGVGFFLEDAEVEAFLASRPVPQNEPMQWVDGEIKEPTPAAVTSETAPAPSNEGVTPTISADLEDARQKADDTVKIQDLYLEYLSHRMKPNLTKIQQAVYGKTGGAFHNNVKKAIALFEGVPVDQVTTVIEKHVASWGTTPGATTDSSGSEDLNFGENPA